MVKTTVLGSLKPILSCQIRRSDRRNAGMVTWKAVIYTYLNSCLNNTSWLPLTFQNLSASASIFNRISVPLVAFIKFSFPFCIILSFYLGLILLKIGWNCSKWTSRAVAAFYPKSFTHVGLSAAMGSTYIWMMGNIFSCKSSNFVSQSSFMLNSHWLIIFMY